MQVNLKERIHMEATVNLNRRIGRRIQALRKAQRITQDQLAEAMDLSVKHISAVECGTASFSLEKLIDVSYILDCSLDYLLLGNDRYEAMSMLPHYIVEILKKNEKEEYELLTEYLLMYRKLRRSDHPRDRLRQTDQDRDGEHGKQRGNHEDL